LLEPLLTRRTLLELQTLSSDGATARNLAGETRRLLHDLSQPLSALQGRAQMLDMKCSPDDPNRKSIQDLAEQSRRAVKLLAELQELQRKYS
jgi:nitrogen-specific signal transduction histidine kinase